MVISFVQQKKLNSPAPEADGARRLAAERGMETVPARNGERHLNYKDFNLSLASSQVSSVQSNINWMRGAYGRPHSLI
jgi:hypothetical protein